MTHLFSKKNLPDGCYKFTIDHDDNIIFAGGSYYNLWKTTPDMLEMINLNLSGVSHPKYYGEYLYLCDIKNESINKIKIENNKIVENKEVIKINYKYYFSAYCLDKEGNIFVCIDNEIIKYNCEYVIVNKSIGDSVRDIVVDDHGNIYMLCSDIDTKIIMLDKEFNFVREILYNNFSSISLDQYNNLYIVCYENIHKYDSKSELINTIDHNGFCVNEIYFNSQNDMYVTAIIDDTEQYTIVSVYHLD